MAAPALRISDPLRLVALGAAALVVAVASLTNADPDLWGHVRFGADIVRDRALPAIDPYSFTQDRPWINHEWLSELQMGLAWLGAGAAGLALLKGTLVAATAVLLWRALRGVDVPVRLIAMAIAAIGTTHVTQSLRPQVWSLLCATLLFRWLSDSTPPRAVAVALLFAIWANLHGGWVLGLMVLIAWAFADSLSKPALRRRWVWLVAIAALATLATPYGWRLWTFLASTVRVGRPIIEEWQPLWALAWPKWLPWLAVGAATIWALRRDFGGRWPAALALAVLAYGSLKVARVQPFFMVGALMFLAPRLRDRWPARSLLAMASRQDAIAAGVILVTALGAAIVVGGRSLGCIAVDDRLPEAAPIAILSQMPPGRLVTFFDWGEYAIWHLGPDIKVSMDGRRETVYSDARLDDHDAILAGTAGGVALLETWQPEYVWLPAASADTRRSLLARGYQVAFESERSFLAFRADRAVPDSTPPPETDRRCFPR